MSKLLQRAWERASIYLPIVLMVVLAMGSWWLVRNAPKPLQEHTDRPPSTAPDYVMERFSVHQFDGSGRLQAVMTGQQARHLPASDTLEVDDIRTRSISPEGLLTIASARQGISNADSSEVQLVGNADVQRLSPDASVPPMRVTGEFLHAWTQEEKVQSHLPVVLTRGKDQFTGDAMDYDHLSETLVLKGRVKGVVHPTAR